MEEDPMSSMFQVMLLRKAIYLSTVEENKDFTPVMLSSLVNSAELMLPGDAKRLMDFRYWALDVDPPVVNNSLIARLVIQWPQVSPAAGIQLNSLMFDQPPPIIYWNQRLGELPEEYQEVAEIISYKLTTILGELTYERLRPAARLALGFGDRTLDKRSWKMLSAPSIAICSQERYNNLKGGDALVEAGKLSRVYGIIPDVLDDVAEFTRRHFLAWTVQTIIVWLEPVEALQDLDEGEVQMTWDLDSLQACYVKLIKACLRRRLQLVIMPSRAESPEQDMQEAIDRAIKEVNASDEFEELAYCMPLSDGYSYGLCGPESNQDFSSTEMVLKTALRWIEDLLLG
jgi:hypothetical protein